MFFFGIGTIAIVFGLMWRFYQINEDIPDAGIGMTQNVHADEEEEYHHEEGEEGDAEDENHAAQHPGTQYTNLGNKYQQQQQHHQYEAEAAVGVTPGDGEDEEEEDLSPAAVHHHGQGQAENDFERDL